MVSRLGEKIEQVGRYVLDHFLRTLDLDVDEFSSLVRCGTLEPQHEDVSRECTDAYVGILLLVGLQGCGG